MSQIEPERGRRIPDPWLLASLAAGIALFFTRFGPRILDPGSIDWLMARHDPSSYYLIWDFFRSEPWSFPLGTVSGYLYPLGSALPLVDGLPLLAFPLKLLSPWLPRTFQYYGFWLLACYALQAFFGYRIARLIAGRGVAALAGAVLFLVMPAFMFREGHIALSSHWTLLAALYLYLARGAMDGRRLAGWWFALLAAIALIHPYLTVMALLFFGAAHLGPGAEGCLRRRLLVLGGGIGITLLVWWIAGYFVGMGGGSVGAEGFGKFSLNLNGPFNPSSFSVFLKDLPTRAGQYEGFAYLGAGWLVLLIAGVCAATVFRFGGGRLRPHAVLAAALGVCFVFALSNVVTWGDSVVLSYKLPKFLDPLTGVFRSSGHFVWPVIYAGCAFLITVLVRTAPTRAATALLAAAALLQVSDQARMVFDRDHFESLEYRTPLSSPDWSAAAAASNCVTTIPPFKFTTRNKADFRDICYLAASNGLPTTAGYAGRVPVDRAAALADSISAAAAAGAADPRNLYIIEKSRFPEFYAGMADSCVATRLDGYHICCRRDVELSQPPLFAGAESIGLSDFLAANAGRTLLLAARDEMTANLSEADREALEKLGVDAGSIGYRDSFAALVDRGKCEWQAVDPEAEVSMSLSLGEEIGGFTAARDMMLVSGGYQAGDRSVLEVDGVDECFGRRGLNILVLDGDQRLHSAATFDTHAGGAGVSVRFRDEI